MAKKKSKASARFGFSEGEISIKGSAEFVNEYFNIVFPHTLERAVKEAEASGMTREQFGREMVKQLEQSEKRLGSGNATVRLLAKRTRPRRRARV